MLSLSLSARHQDHWQVFPGRPSKEELPHSRWGLHRQRRHSGNSYVRIRERWTLQLRSSEHWARGAHLAGHQWHSDRWPVVGPNRLQCSLQELGDGHHPAARRRSQPELCHPLHHGQREVVWWELPSRKSLCVWIQHRLKAFFSWPKHLSTKIIVGLVHTACRKRFSRLSFTQYIDE